MLQDPMFYVITGIIAAVVALVFFFVGVAFRKSKAEKTIGSAEKEAKRILSDAIQNAETRKKELLMEAKDEAHQLRTETDRDLRERRSEVQRQERRLQQKEETLDKKIENFEIKEENIAKRAKEVEEKLQESEQIKRSQLEMLERISGYSKEQAKDYLLSVLDGELTHAKAMKISEFEQRTKEESETIAREILSRAIQRCAADHSSEVTVSVVPLPNDEMKGRIIGREGRNIRALETATGVDLIIDDTPEAITVSSFDPIRREVARLSLEKLITDGRIHPARIEEMVTKAQNDVNNTIKREGERAMLEAEE